MYKDLYNIVSDMIIRTKAGEKVQISVPAFIEATRYNSDYNIRDYSGNKHVISENEELMEIVSRCGRDMHWLILTGSFHFEYDTKKSIEVIKDTIKKYNYVKRWFEHAKENNFDFESEKEVLYSFMKAEDFVYGYYNYSEDCYEDRWIMTCKTWYHLYKDIYEEPNIAAKIKLAANF